MTVDELGSNGIVDYEGDSFEALVTELRDRGLGSNGSVRHASACLFDGRALHALKKQWMEAHLTPR